MVFTITPRARAAIRQPLRSGPRALSGVAAMAVLPAAFFAAVLAGPASAQRSSTITTLEADKARLSLEKRELQENFSRRLNAILRRLADVRNGRSSEHRSDRDRGRRLEDKIRYWSNAEKFDAIMSDISALRDRPAYRSERYTTSAGSGSEVCRAELRSATSRVGGLEADKARLVDQISDSKYTHGAHLVSMLTTIVDLKHQLADRLGQPRPSVLTSIEAMQRKTSGQKYESTVAELDSLRRMISDAKRQCDRRADVLGSDLKRLRDQMAAQMQTDHFDVSTYPDNELIRGQKGRYYVIDLKDASANGVRFQFEPGKYVISARQKRFRKALNELAQKILQQVDGKVEYRILVRGSADASPTFRGRFEPDHEYTNIRYMRNLGRERYVNEFGTMQIDGPTFKNSDLPNLRAAFLQDTVVKVYPLNKPVILEGSVTSRVDQSDRNVELMLYINW